MTIASGTQERREGCWLLHTPMQPLKLHGIQALVVDDNGPSGMLLDIFLKRLGAEVFVAQSVAEAIHFFHSSPPDILISDIWLKGNNGYDLIQWVRSLSSDEGRETPAIALSADVTLDNQQTALVSGFQAFVPKPIRFSTLALTLHHLLEPSIS